MPALSCPARTRLCLQQDLDIRRETVAISSVYHTALADPDGGLPVGYIRVTQFSNSSADDVRAAVEDLEVRVCACYCVCLCVCVYTCLCLWICEHMCVCESMFHAPLRVSIFACAV